MNEELFIFKKLYIWLICVSILLSAGAFIFNRFDRTVDTGLVRYQEFQEIYNTTKQIDQNLCNLKALPEEDKMFKDFSKSQQMLALKSNLNRWIAEYNAKSALLNFNIWKSDSLPYTLTVNQYSCGN